MSKTAKWVIGIAIALIVLQFAMPFVMHLIFPNSYSGYGMMGGRGFGYGMHAPMMGGFGFMPFGGMWFIWLIPVGILVLIGLGIAWLVKQLTAKPS